MLARPHARPRWWLLVSLGLYLVTQGVNSWVEVFGPGSVGLLPAATGFRLVEVAPGLPMDRAGLQVGDEVLSVDGYPVAGMPDWFVARANFRRGVPTEIEFRRGDDVLRRSFVVRSTNGEQLSLTALSFQLTRWAILLLAMVLVLARPSQSWASWLALILSAIAVTEGNPSAGWLATLRRLPIGTGVLVGWATTSWLFIPALWLGFCHSFPRPAGPFRMRLAAVGFVGTFGSFVTLALVALISRSPKLAMPQPFDDVGATRLVDSLFSVTPQLFLNPWPWYNPNRQSLLLGGWLTAAVVLLAVGFSRLVAAYRAANEPHERRGLGLFLAGLGGAFLVGLHNALVRNWGTRSTTARPVWLGDSFVAAEAPVFALAVLLVLYAAFLISRSQQTSRTR